MLLRIPGHLWVTWTIAKAVDSNPSFFITYIKHWRHDWLCWLGKQSLYIRCVMGCQQAQHNLQRLLRSEWLMRSTRMHLRESLFFCQKQKCILGHKAMHGWEPSAGFLKLLLYGAMYCVGILSSEFFILRVWREHWTWAQLGVLGSA